jgi:hypothetical protein
MRAFLLVGVVAVVTLGREARAQADSVLRRDSVRVERAAAEFSNRLDALFLQSYRATKLGRAAPRDSQAVGVPPTSCPMPVATQSRPTVPMPVARADSLAMESMPIATSGCSGLVFRYQR